MSFDIELARGRLEEARRQAAEWRLAESARPARRPVRVVIGLGLIRLGRLMAARAPRPAGQPDRVRA